jgi:hypothetical protein
VSAAGGDEPSGDVQDAEPESFGFPEPRDAAGEGDGLGPGEKLCGELNELEPDRVLGELVQRQVPQSGIFEPADAVLGAGALPLPQFEVGEPATAGVRREAGDLPAVVVGDPKLRAVVGSFAAGDDPHPVRPANVGVGQVAGELSDLPTRGSPSTSTADRHA